MVLGRLIRGIRAAAVKFKGDKGITVIDFRRGYVALPGGDVIPADRIVKVDTERGVVVYIDYDGTLREAPYRPWTGAQAGRGGAVLV